LPDYTSSTLAVIALSFNHRTGADQRLCQSMKKVVSFLCLRRVPPRERRWSSACDRNACGGKAGRQGSIRRRWPSAPGEF